MDQALHEPGTSTAGPVDPSLREARRLQVIDAALTRFAADGYRATTTAAICQESGIGSGTLVHHVTSKASILVAVLDQGTVETREHVAAQVGRTDARAVPWTGWTTLPPTCATRADEDVERHPGATPRSPPVHLEVVPSRHVKRPLVLAGLTAAVVGVAAGGAGIGARNLLERQAETARRLIGKPLGEDALDADRTFKKKHGDRIDLLVLGDSIAAGLGAERAKDTFGARLARRLAKATQRAVRLTTAAQVGSESSMLGRQLDTLPVSYRADVAVIVVGGNDVTHRVPVAESVRHLVEAIDRLREQGTAVVVGTCPDLGALRPVPQPLRSLGSRASRQLAQAQRVGALAAGAHAVSLADVVGPFFITNPDEMFSLDRFHPSALGYQRTAKAVLPSVLAALGVHDRVPFGHASPVRGDMSDTERV